MAGIILDVKYYTLRQNNSGGYFMSDHDCGIGEILVIESPSKSMATLIADEVVESFREFCDCCGERWDTDFWGEDGLDMPSEYGKPLSGGYYLHKLDGSIVCVCDK